MSPASVNGAILGPLFQAVLPPMFDTPEARVLLLAIGLQESRFEHRVQVVSGGGEGPARGYWQFERGGGVRGVLEHPASAKWAAHVCQVRDVAPEAGAVHRALATDDILAAGFARLLLFTDPKPLPDFGDAERALAYYLRTWRPGAHSRGTPAQKAALEDKFRRNYEAACRAIERRAAA